MEWQDEGIVLGARRHGEANVILELMTAAHGRHMGLVRGGRSRRLQPVLQPGNSVAVVWRARIEEHLGLYAVEATAIRAARFIASPLALHGLGTLTALLRLMPERDPHPGLYEALTVLMEHMDDPAIAPALIVRFELAVLAGLGFGLDLSSCAATGSTQELVYVSPKSGRAVSRTAGEPYGDRLLPLPSFLREGGLVDTIGVRDVLAGFQLTGLFFARHVYEPRGLAEPDARRRLIEFLARGEAT
ncbi:DNA repair protein RecO [Chelatococcus daeguensis]|uniref:DNA repair protein RecO n=1 Tax=Chelatococcus sambhunathii TaxID=363953 RepID=A0ABP2ABY2_9HYPH|nr:MULTISPECIES: DNA repair protein RecO [Chelatococcus]KZE35868.1 DNA repair protein RecO [Chelatococcus daeguensis]MBM3085179.1 DNA repair protein RecO [Chelatococcus daeguensis]CUA90093.1 DNA replication and repair protein RecO [Chelatococcus sambhunathii]